MNLIDLVGEHMLDAVDFSVEQIKGWGDEFEPCQVMRFRLDGVCYTAVEDPDDGYRSSMKELIVDPDAEMKNTFAPIKVIGRHRTKGEYGEDDVMEFIDAITGKIIIEVGTADIDDYYPGFVAFFDPLAMVQNS
jgi:hypothetical protein